jgi:hypothetical protein
VEKARVADLRVLVQESIDMGLPLLWSVRLPAGESGVSPATNNPRNNPFVTEVAPAPVGHMRLIIGYNAKSGTVIFSDSWGAGHERKTMSMTEAADMTTAVFAMTPIR